MLMFYAKEYFDKAGIAYPKEGWTYQEFQDLAVKLTRQLDGKQVYGYEWNNGYNRQTPLAAHDRGPGVGPHRRAQEGPVDGGERH